MTGHGDCIRAERHRYRLTQGELAERCGVGVRTLVDIERDRIEISDAERERIIGAIRGFEPAIGPESQGTQTAAVK